MCTSPSSTCAQPHPSMQLTPPFSAPTVTPPPRPHPRSSCFCEPHWAQGLNRLQ
jgi:hypothetical protein